MPPLLIAAVYAVVSAAVAGVRVHADWLPPPAKAQAEAAVGAAVDEAARRWGLDPAGIQADLTLHPDAAGYEAADARLTGGRFRANQAFALDAAAHVQLQPPLTTEQIDAAGLPAQTLRLCAHETAHLVRGSLPNHRAHAKWLVDGVAQLVSEHTARALGHAPTRADDPWTATQILRLRRAAEADRLPRIAELLEDGQGALSMSERYDARWALAAWMDETGVLDTAIAESRRLGATPSHGERVAAAVARVFTDRGIADPDAAWRAWLEAQPASWDQVYRSLETGGEEWTQAAFPDRNAVAWTTTETSGPFILRGRVHVLPGLKQQMNILLARSNAGFVSVALTAGWGVTVLHYDSAADRWNRLASSEAPSLRAGEPTNFSVDVAGRSVRVRVAGEFVAEAEAPIPLRGAWGLGAQAGSAGVWSDVGLYPAPADGQAPLDDKPSQ